jgi:vesicle coat complex subunit
MNVLIPKGLAHPAPEVRGAAINALCYFSEHLIPDIFDYHAVIIPAMMKYIGDLSPKVVSKALIAIDVFFDGMEQEDILQYLPVVIPRLI